MVVRPRQWQGRREEAFRVCLGSGSNRICLRIDCECEGKRRRLLPGFGEDGGAFTEVREIGMFGKKRKGICWHVLDMLCWKNHLQGQH